MDLRERRAAAVHVRKDVIAPRLGTPWDGTGIKKGSRGRKNAGAHAPMGNVFVARVQVVLSGPTLGLVQTLSLRLIVPMSYGHVTKPSAFLQYRVLYYVLS